MRTREGNVKGRPNQSVAFHPKQALLPFTDRAFWRGFLFSSLPSVFWFIGMPPIFAFSFGAIGKGELLLGKKQKFYQRSKIQIEPLRRHWMNDLRYGRIEISFIYFIQIWKLRRQTCLFRKVNSSQRSASYEKHEWIDVAKTVLNL